MREDLTDETRAIRKLSERFGFDVQRICDDLMRKQKASGKDYVIAPEHRPEGASSEQQARAERKLADGLRPLPSAARASFCCPGPVAVP